MTTMLYYAVPNEVGLAKQARAIALNQKLNITTMVVGDGGGLPVVPRKDKNALVREVYRAPITNLETDPQVPGRFVATLIIPPEKGGFDITEGMLLCDDGTPYANAALTPGRKSTVAEGGIGEYIIEMVFDLVPAEASVIQLIIDPFLTLATRQYVAANYFSKAEVAAMISAVAAADLSNAATAPAEGVLIFKSHGDKALQSPDNGKLLTVYVARDIDLTAGKCRLVAPGTEKIKTENGEFTFVNLGGPGPFIFVRDGIWRQL